AAAAPGAAGEAAAAVPVGVTPLQPTRLSPGDTLARAARVTNGTAETLAAPAVALGIDGRALATRSALESWATTGVDGRVGIGVTSEDLGGPLAPRSEEHTSELQSRENLVCRLLLEKKNA